VIETYIFSALCLLVFIWFLLTDQSAYLLIVAGVATFGITITNIVQQMLTASVVRRTLKPIVFIFIAIMLLSIGLNVIAHAMYPVPYFFLPSNLVLEKEFVHEISIKHIGEVSEVLLIYNIAAPQPRVEIRKEMPRFHFRIETIRSYAWFGWPALIVWIAMLALTFFHFPKKIRGTSNDKYLVLAMLVCLVFNFLLHIRYGAEPFLYTADWTYALILFTALTLAGLAERLWFRVMLFILVMSLLINNLGFLYIIARKVSEYLVQ
jgi:hypothetical protein